MVWDGGKQHRAISIHRCRSCSKRQDTIHHYLLWYRKKFGIILHEHQHSDSTFLPPCAASRLSGWAWPYPPVELQSPVCRWEVGPIQSNIVHYSHSCIAFIRAVNILTDFSTRSRPEPSIFIWWLQICSVTSSKVTFSSWCPDIPNISSGYSLLYEFIFLREKYFVKLWIAKSKANHLVHIDSLVVSRATQHPCNDCFFSSQGSALRMERNWKLC